MTLLEEITAYMAETNMNARQVGRLAMGDPFAVSRLKKDTLGIDRQAKLRVWLKQRRAAKVAPKPALVLERTFAPVEPLAGDAEQRHRRDCVQGSAALLKALNRFYRRRAAALRNAA
ncbi:hypothetical protein [Sphingomonas colocasiae]|uniref:XRE family transcriptional regulator n=1 Tax=Sphingomonas colocasiae TaxID=1848973 RepID=A0ABS7PYR5_9SPHN|nr:hypothetical protein [Sphingomonas colocasiae]MBY8826099.1 hypothetical protein [Sphingomonas colocasiae]